MHILLMEMELHLPNCHSLKEKRSVLKPLLNELRRDYNVSVSEVDAHDTWQTAVIAVVCVAGMKSACERNERDVLNVVETNGEAQLTVYKMQWL
ncbi:DUF503 domain-containing protein [Candidatus Sumerlaeota bacterium]|nr:DUF503 domain-containing protein [Candidatus Sumerlaeota bacterium]